LSDIIPNYIVSYIGYLTFGGLASHGPFGSNFDDRLGIDDVFNGRAGHSHSYLPFFSELSPLPL
jgi:hypothetical protein